MHQSALPVQKATASQVEALAKKAANHQPQAQENLLNQLYPMLAAVVNQYPKVFPSREDALQEGRLIVLQSLYTFDATRGVPFLGYVRKKVWHHFMNQARVRQDLPMLDATHATTLSYAGDDGNESWLSQLPDTSPLPDEQLINEELHRWLDEALQHMHADHQVLFNEHYGKGKTLKQIARETDQHPVTLSRHKAAMLTTLRQQLKQ